MCEFKAIKTEQQEKELDSRHVRRRGRMEKKKIAEQETDRKELVVVASQLTVMYVHLNMNLMSFCVHFMSIVCISQYFFRGWMMLSACMQQMVIIF